MKKLRVLNNYPGIGGNRKLWDNDKFQITAVEINPQVAEVYQRYNPNDEVIVGDAHKYLLENYEKFDIYWGSPPCQKNSKMARVNHKRYNLRQYPDLRLYEEVIFLTEYFKGKWVIENVDPYYDPLIKAQKIGRHLFWANFHIKPFHHPNIDNFIEAKFEDIKKWLGFDDYNDRIYLNGTHDYTQILRNCVHPKLGLHVMDCAVNSMQSNEKKQLTMVGEYGRIYH